MKEDIDLLTQAELLNELDRLDACITDLRGARAQVTYDLEWAVKERDRLRRHLALLTQNDEGAA